MSTSNHYQTLGVEPNATRQEIKHAYNKLAAKWHPDRAPDDLRVMFSKMMSEINVAYSILGDPDKRKAYDEGRLINEDAEMKPVITMLISIINTVVDYDRPNRDFISAARELVRQGINEAQGVIGSLRDERRKVERVLKNIRSRDGKTVVIDIVKARLDDIEARIEHHRKTIETAQKADAILRDFEYGVIPEPPNGK